jgi:ADP-heptose:LPS heptosyltransferase
MKIALHVTERIFQKWPNEYCAELTQKLLDRGHRVFYVKEDFAQDANRKVIEEADLFIGAPSEWTEYAEGAGVKTLKLLGPTLKGDGVKSPTICHGCIDRMDNRTDCFFEDEICMWEITPNDILEAI